MARRGRARDQRGVVQGTLVPGGSKVGDVLRAEADFDLDGVTIVGLSPIQAKKRNEAERIEIIGAPVRDQATRDLFARQRRTSRP